MRKILIPCLAVLALGCSSDEPGTDPVTPEPAALAFPDTPDKLMTNFVAVCDEMAVADYADLIDPAFLMVLQQETINRFPGVGTQLDAQDELTIAGNIFGGQEGSDHLGQAVAPIRDIDILNMEQLSDWAVVEPGGSLEGDLVASYEIYFSFRRDQQHYESLAEGQVQFYVAATDSVHEGEDKPFYRLTGMVDLTRAGGKAVDSESFGTIKVMYR
jgi:hypothetical protein